jgi:outer membrane receptor protein involved in Fe transport
VPFENPIPHSEITQHTAFGYAYFELPKRLLWTLGLAIDDYAAQDLHQLTISPKLGLQWDLHDHLRLRLAAFRETRPALVANRTIRPTQVAGFNELQDDPDGTVGWSFGAALDAKITDTLFAGLEISGRRLREPVFLLGDGRYSLEDRNERLLRSYLDWTPFSEWAVAAEVEFDTYDSRPSAVVDLPTEVETLSVPLSVRWFSPVGLFAGLTTTFVHQTVDRQGGFAEEGRDNFALIDVAAGYRFPNRRGLVSLEVRNLLDSDFRYQDDSFREFTNEPSVGPYIPERSLIGRLTVNF